MDALWWFYTILLGAAFAQIAMGMAVQWKIRAATSEPLFWPTVLWLAFLIILLPFIAFGVLSAGIGFACLLPLICILVPISWVVTIVIEQANAAIVLLPVVVLPA